MSQSPIQRFVNELRRRHVPQTTAIYLVVAWAVIEFSDVVVPNLNGPQWIVEAVIIAALVGFPAMLVLAWVFEMGPEGIHRTGPDGDPGAAPGPAGPGATAGPGAADTSDAGSTQPAASPAPTHAAPWMAAVAILVVAVGSALAVAFVLHGGPDEGAAPAVGVDGSGADRDGGVDTARLTAPVPPVPTSPELSGLEGLEGLFSDSVTAAIRQALQAAGSVAESMDLGSLTDMAERAAMEEGVGVIVTRPEPWRYAAVTAAPVTLLEGARLEVEGLAFDTLGIVRVTVDGTAVVDLEEAQATVRFVTTLTGIGSAGTRAVPVVARTADGREIRRDYQIIQLPGGTP